MLTKDEVSGIVMKYGKNENDTGNIQVQIAILTARVNYLTEHFKTHIHDNHSRRGLLKLVGQRKNFLSYLRKNTPEDYRELIGQLGIRK